MANQREIEQLLRNVPLSTPGEVSAAETMFGIFMSIRNTALEGILPEGVTMPGTGTVLNIPVIIDQMRSGNYADAAVTLISIVGDAAGAYSFLINAGVEAGAITGLGATASSGVVAGMVGEIAGPAAIAAAVLVETFRIPSGVSENNAKLYYIADASGILTSWMFNMPEINPHPRLMAEARTGGYNRTDISSYCRTAHERVEQLWRRNYQGNSQAKARARASVQNSWEEHWLQVGRALEARLSPFPRGVGASWVRNQIRQANQRIARARTQARQASLQAANRRAAGGEWIRLDGNDVFIPDR
jgi:hypothetical protein